MRLARENSHFRRRLELIRSDHTADVNAGGLEPGPQLSSGFVVSHGRYQRNAGAERCEIDRTVCGAAGNGLRLFVTQDEDRCFTRHAADVSVKKLIGNRVADDQQPPVCETTHDFDEAIHCWDPWFTIDFTASSKFSQTRSGR